MQVGDLVRFADIFGNDIRIGLVLAVDVGYTRTTFGWVPNKTLEVISASR